MITTLIIATNLVTAGVLPEGPSPAPVTFAHFPDTLHAFVWRNWTLTPVERMAEVVGATPEQVLAIGKRMGLPDPPDITKSLLRRSYITTIRRNWHLLPYGQLQQLLGWSAEELAFTLQEDDFLWVKLGRLKPDCAPLTYSEPDAEVRARAREIGGLVAEHFPDGIHPQGEPLFAFVDALSAVPEGPPARADKNGLTPRYCYSYLATYGDPLLDPLVDPYPEGLLARLAAQGVDGVWLQAVLYTLAPFPWDPALSARYEQRLESLRRLVALARRYGIGVYLYLNEPRSMPVAFFEQYPELRGAAEPGSGEHVTHAAMCTSVPEVRDYLRDAVGHICREAPDLAGFFTITASENLTNCWSRYSGEQCPRCGVRPPADVVAEVTTALHEGIRDAGGGHELITWDWGWKDEWAPDIIAQLPVETALQSVSEWDLPIERGGTATVCSEYSISCVGPGPRAQRHWKLARDRGMRVLAKVQAANTWEISTVPYIPALHNAGRHAANLREIGVDGLMLGWTLGGYPSTNLELFQEVVRPDGPPLEEALRAAAERRFGPDLAPDVVAYWRSFSTAFSEFPYHTTVVYAAPVQIGPANNLWEEPTGYGATMVCFPYDDLTTWRAVYPEDVFIGQLRKVADGVDAAVASLRKSAAGLALSTEVEGELTRELGIAQAVSIIYRSASNQGRFVQERARLTDAQDPVEERRAREALRGLVQSELDLAKRLHAIQCADSRIGFEASNHYFFVPTDLVEKVINAEDLLNRWLAARQ